MELEKLTQQTIEICKGTGEFILTEKSKVSTNDVEIKSLNSLVSYVDKTAESQLVEGLTEILPEAGFITEEDTPDQKDKELKWIIDPLDGTTNYLYDIPVFAISVALMKGDEVVLGVIYELGQKEMFSAWQGGGAWLNGKPIKVRQNDDMSQSLLATGFPYYDFERLQAFFKLLGELFEKSRGIRRLGSAATDLAYVACGRFDGFFEYGLHAWDVAAGVVIVQEAGGKVSDYSGGKEYIFGGEIVAGSALLFDELYHSVNDYMG